MNKNQREHRIKLVLASVMLAAVLVLLSRDSGVGSTWINKSIKNINIEEVREGSAESANRKLIEGNRRFALGKPLQEDISLQKRRDLKVNGQKPFAVILSCSDSRVPPEIVFDQGLGDIFVVRNAGNVVEPVALGSIEYSIKYLGTPLIVVMGHEDCGAVKAAVEGEETTDNIEAIIKKIEPSVEKAKSGGSKEGLKERAENENIVNSIEQIKKSPVVKEMLETGRVKIVGAKYHLESGEVIFINE